MPTSSPTSLRRPSPVGRRRHRLNALLLAATAIALASCNADRPITAPSAEMLSICHTIGTAGTLMDIRASQLAEHQAHGDYVAQLFVAKENAGRTDATHFTRIGDAIASARATRIARGETTSAWCYITVSIAAGVYQGSVQPSTDPAFERLPLVIDVPNIALVGSFAPRLDATLRPIAATAAEVGGAAVIVASPGLQSVSTGTLADKYAEPLILVNSHPDGTRADGATIKRLILRSGNEAATAIVGGNAVWAMRTDRILIRENQIDGGFGEPIELRASSAAVANNLLSGRGQSCALCMFGPGTYVLEGNRQVGFAGRLGILVFPAMSAPVPPGVEPFELPTTALVTVTATNNELRDHQENPFGIGMRIAAIGPGAPNVAGTARVLVENNDFSSNRFGMIVEAGFPVTGTLLRGDVELTLRTNNLSSSCQVPLLVTLVSQPTAVGRASAPPLRGSAFTLKLNGSLAWNDAWFVHPAATTNTLTVDGGVIDPGSRIAYDAAKVCPVS